MAKSRRTVGLHRFDEAVLAAKREKPAPQEFVLDAIAALSPAIRPMFGCLAVYVEDRIVLILRDKPKSKADNGVWLAITQEHHESLRREFPHMRSIRLLGERVTSWQILPADAPDFEETALRACALILEGDPRIGKIPKRRSISRARDTERRPKSMGRGAARSRR